MEKPVEGSSAFEVASGCPAVKLETDTTGQYSAQVLPGIHRVAIPHDAASHPSLFEHNAYSDFEIEGWAGNTTPSFIDEFSEQLKEDGNGNFNHSDPDYIQWDASEKLQWNQSASYPGYPDINPELALPSDAYERIDFVYNPTPRVVVEQTQPLSPDPGCDSTRLQGLPTSLGDIFIGQASVELEYDGVDYASPSAFYLEAYRLGAEDVQPDAYDGTPPFPFGLPVMNSGAQYCANIQAKCTLPRHMMATLFRMNPRSLALTTKWRSKTPCLILKTSLLFSSNSKGASTMVSKLQHPPMTRRTSSREDFSYRPVQGDQQISTWKPFSDIIDDQIDPASLPGILHNPDGTVAFDHNRFDAILFGGFVSAPGVPVSAEPTLEFILRDPR